MTTTRAVTETPQSALEGRTCGSLTSSHQDSATTPGRMKHARLSTWPFTTCAAHHISQSAGTQPCLWLYIRAAAAPWLVRAQ